MRKLVGLIIVLFSNSAFADNILNESIRAKNKQEDIEKNLFSYKTEFKKKQPESINEIEKTNEICLPIYQIKLNQEKLFDFLITELEEKSGFTKGMCLDSNNISSIRDNARNLLISSGWITSQVEVEEQDLNSGNLILSVYPGYIDETRFIQKGMYLNTLGEFLVLSYHNGNLLNIRDIEQTLENIRLIPSSEVNIQIEPSNKKYHSKIIIERNQRNVVKGGITLDNLGSKLSGKYQANSYLNISNLFGINDSIYLSYYQDTGRHKKEFKDQFGNKTKSGTKGYGFYYTLPLGYSKIIFSHNQSRYDDAVEGIYTNYLYRGKTENTNLKLERVIFRNQSDKIVINGTLWHSSMKKYLDSNELIIQRRKMSGWKLGFYHETNIGHSALDYSITYKRGTGFRSIKAQEEFNENNDVIPGTSRMKIINAELNITTPFKIENTLFSLENFLSIQWNKTSLVPQDKLSIANNYTVRGFDGENNISGEKGWYNQNTLNLHYSLEHLLYAGIDYGRVSGLSTEFLESKEIIGGVIGLKGTYNLGGKIHYNTFVGKPFKKPNNLDADRMSFGFSVGYHF